MSHLRIRSEDQEEEDNAIPFDYGDYIDKLLSKHSKALRPTFERAFISLQQSKMSKYYLGNRHPRFSLRDNKLECLLCLDEAGELFSTRANETVDMSSFGALRRALRHRATGQGKTKRLQSFGIVTDTTSRVSELSPSKSLDRSLGSSQLSLDLFKPLWEINTFDIFGNSAMYENLPTASQQLSPWQHRGLFSFGRPLWGSLMKNIDIHSLRKLILSKLNAFERRQVSGHNQRVRHTQNARIRDLALISYRCNFYVNLQSLADMLSSTYLHYIADISDDRTLVRTLQPSEPVLAWVSAGEMREPETRLAIVKALHWNLQRGFVSVGDVGEFVAAVILLLAVDNANGQGLPQPVTLSTFLTSLFPTIVEEVEHVVAFDENLSQLWSRGSVFFTHFYRMERRQVTVQNLRKAYGRSAALIAPNDFQGCDLVIPVFLGKEAGFTYVIVQVQNDKSLHLTGGLKKKAWKELLPHDHLEDPEFPAYFGIFMSLRGEKKGGGKQGHPAVEVVYPTEKTVDVFSRVVILAAGLDERICPVLSEPSEMVPTLVAILNCTAWINMVERSQYLQSLYPIDVVDEVIETPMDIDS